MGQFIHLDPEERKQIVENIVKKLEPQLEIAVKSVMGKFAITEKEVLERVELAAEIATRGTLEKVLRKTWFHRLFFK